MDWNFFPCIDSNACIFCHTPLWMDDISNKNNNWIICITHTDLHGRKWLVALVSYYCKETISSLDTRFCVIFFSTVTYICHLISLYKPCNLITCPVLKQVKHSIESSHL